MDRIAPRFTRCEPLRNAGALMLGLVSDIGKKNCWTLAELSGHTSPDRLQHLLARAKWDADAVRDDLRGYVVDHLGDDDAVLVVDLYRPRNYAEAQFISDGTCGCRGLFGSGGAEGVGIVLLSIDASVVGAGCFGSGDES
jgi:DDE superfamily endonuclease